VSVSLRKRRRGRATRVRASIPLALVLSLCVLPAGAGSPGERVFTPEQILHWDAHSFEGWTRYQLVRKDGRPAVHAVCKGGTASGLFFRGKIDLRKTPVIEWSWQIAGTLSGVDEKSRSGDDYPARLYVVDEHSLLRWRTRALNYVWSSEQPIGSDWPNAFASQARMIAVESGPPEASGWVRERRNLRRDFERYHGRSLDAVNALAIMTDCDNTGRPTEAWYGRIRLLPEQDGSSPQ